MSRINGDKARSAIERRRRTAQRAKDRVRRALPPQAPAPKKAKRAAKPAEIAAAKPAEKPAPKAAEKPAPKAARKPAATPEQ